MIFAFYAAATFIGALTHEIWFDEAQAWCIIRDNDIAGILQVLQYEGHPPLWYLVLYPFAKLGAPCTVMPFISWTISCVTVALILWRAPFGLLLKACVVFSSGFFFYNSVTSRVYCLIPLILLFIAELYPQRRKHPILYGAMIALLANTHVIMCGLVGILGIFMLIDLFKEWKASSKKENAMKLAGLATAAVGVLLLVLPLLASLSLNNEVTALQHSPYLIASRFVTALTEISGKLFVFESENMAVYLALSIMATAMLLFIVVMRHYRRGFAMTAVFSLMFIVVTQIVYNRIQTTRAAVFVYTMFFILWISKKNEQPVRTDYRYEPESVNMISRIISKVTDWDKNCEKSAAVLLSFILAASVPRAVSALIFDYTSEYALSASTAEYIESELPTDSIFVLVYNNGVRQISAYAPQLEFYSLYHECRITHTVRYKCDEYPDWNAVYADLAEYPNVYLLHVYGGDRDLEFSNAVYSADTDCREFILAKTADIFEIDIDKHILPYAGTQTDISTVLKGIMQ